MEQKTGTHSNTPAAPLGWLIAPLAVLLAIAAIKLVGVDFELNVDNLTPMIIVGVAGMLGIVPSMLHQSESVSVSKSTLSLSALAVALIGSQAVYALDYGAFSGLLFAFVAFGVHFLSIRGRHELATVVVFMAMGINVGIVVASDALATLPEIYNLAPETEQSSFVSTLNLKNQAVGYLFFSYMTIFILLGMLVATFARGFLFPVSEDGMFSFMNNDTSSFLNKNNLPLQIALAFWGLAHVASLWHFDTVGVADKLGITSVEGYHGHFGFWPAFFTGMIGLIIAGMFAERWHTRAMTLGSLWALYLVSSWYDAGMFTVGMLEGNWGSLIWLGITFFIGVGIYSISTHEKWGGWVNRDDHEYSGARLFWNQHWSSIMIGLAFFFGLVIRTQWYVVPSMNAFGTGNWDMTGGSDPWYMKRVVDYILANNAHMIFDADRHYPIGGINPRPPIFTWSIAVVASILNPFFSDGSAVWWAILSLPAVYGSLTILPVAFIAREHINEKAAVVAAWLIAFMPAHVSHTTWALADHDAFIMLFITLGFMFWLRAVKYAGSDRLLRNSSPSLKSFVAAFSAVATERRAAFSAAVLAGVSFGIVSLGWKGFVVGPSILFLAYAAQVAMNMFRRRDSTTLNVLFLTMLSVNFLMAFPFYGHPQISLLFDGTGLQPFLFIMVFTITISFVTTGFRDKPWLLVLGVLAGTAAVFFIVLWLLKQANLSNAWDVLFTGSGYFTKTKIFGTVAEANAPNRGQLFAQFGPITFVLSLIMGVLCIWSALRERKQTKLVFGVWIIAASFMAWTAARFMFNATPAIAVLGAWGIVSLWKWANWDGLVKTWKRLGIRSPEDRIRGARVAVWRTPSFSAIMLVMIMLFGQQFTYGLDAAIPSSNNAEDDLDETIYNIIPDIFRWEIGGFSLLDDSNYDGNWYLGSFGSGFNDNGWNTAYEWLANQDQDVSYSHRPAFVSWWDYGFQALDTGEHPSVSDNFQTGIPATGNMLLARSQEDLVSMFIWQLGQGDLHYNRANTGDSTFTSGYQNLVNDYLSDEQMDLFNKISTDDNLEDMQDFAILNSYEVYRTNDDTVMAVGYHHVDGIFDDSKQYWRVYDGGERILCTDSLSATCVDGDWSEESEADRTFTNNIRSGNDNVDDVTHYIIGDYWYTADLVEEFDSVATTIHRRNAQLALTVQLLSSSLDENQIVDLYDDLITELEGYYTVQDYEAGPGITTDRDHEIRYYAIDNRLYPRAGRYTADMNYNQGQPMGIFGAPTILSGQDVSTYMDEVYETIRGDFPDEMTRSEVDEAITQDFLNQQSGADIDPLQVEDVRVDHNPAFFDTMLARAYVGYGASSLGVNAGSANPQPAQHFGQSGSPGSILSQALPLPGAMTNHFVIANWYSPEANASVTADQQSVGISSTNTLVKILKYYSGAEISGQVTMSDNGEGLSGVRMLVERDAFSGEGSEDLDPDTYWVPIGFTDVDENGHWSFDAPAGRIRVSAFAGDYYAVEAQDSIRTGEFSQGLADILTESNDDRQINAISAILGQVANMTWLGETQHNITSLQADRYEDVSHAFDIAVESSGVSGLVTWSGDESFDGDALVSTDFILRNIWSMTENYTLTTTNGSFSSTDSRILQGTGEVTFAENGTFDSEGVAFADDFTGTFTRSIADNRVYTSNGTWNGKGTLLASWVSNETVVDCADNETAPMPENQTLCVFDSTSTPVTYLLDGSVEANGRLTSDGISTLVTQHIGDSFEATGSFEGTGTLNGTGLFIGVGSFSGPMVQPGSFYITGLIPGVYNMVAQLENGKEVLLPDPVNVGISPSYDLEMTMPGSIFKDTLFGVDGVLSNQEIQLIDVDLGTESMIKIDTDAEGNFSEGPLASGDYYYRIDVDGDGWYESNHSFIVLQDSQNITLQSIVPEMYDLTLTLSSPVDPLTQVPFADISQRLITFTSDDATLPELNATSNETGEVYIELPIGSYTVSDETGSDYILFDYVTIEDQDISLSTAYAIGTWVNGSIRATDGGIFSEDYNYSEWAAQDETIKLLESQPASGLEVSFVSNDLSFSTKVGTDGNYSIRLPSGNNFHMTMFSIASQMSAGQLISLNGDAELDLGLMYLKPTITSQGIVYLYDNNSTWDEFVPGYESQVVVATDNDGVEWRTTISESGEFTFDLQQGVWDFTVEDSILNSTTITDYNLVESVDTIPNPLELFVNPAHLVIELNIFMDSSSDGVFGNGTSVSPSFTLSPLNDHGVEYNFTSDDYSSAGNISVTLEPGLYGITFDTTSADDVNATDFNLVGAAPFETLIIGLDSYDEPVAFPLRNEYLVTGQMTNVSGGSVESQFLLRNEADDIWHNIASDANGSFASYVPAGDWVAIVAPFTADNDSLQTFRQSFTVGEDSSLRTNLTFTSLEVITINFQLQELDTDTNMSNVRVTLVSHDGFGNVTLSKSDINGNVSENIMPGNWSMFLNKSDPQLRWTLNTSTSPFNTADAVDNVLDLGIVNAELYVQIGGKVFWDVNDDGAPGATEGVENVTVTVVGLNNTEVNENISTDEAGVWRLFVPILDEYQVNVSKLGFGTESYNISNSSAFPVYSSQESHDIEITAGNVTVSGNVTDINDAERLNGSSVVLYPSTGMAGVPLTASSVFSNDQLNWSAVISPGEWIVVVTEANADENGGGVAIGLLDASVSEGATLDLEMSLGGWIDLTTSWTDISLVEHHAGSDDNGSILMNESATVTFSIGADLEWDIPVDSDGTISVLMPSSDVEMDSSFITIQHDLALEMEYIGGTTTTVAEGRSPVTLSYTRSINSDTSVTMVANSTVNATVESELSFMAIEEDEGYKFIEFDVEVNYDGTETVQVFDVLGQVGVAPDEPDWSIEFWNGSAYVDAYEVTLGIGNNSNDTSVQTSAVIGVRITVANQSSAWHLQEPHTLKVRLVMDGSPSSELAVSVQVPQIFGFELSEQDEAIGIGAGGSNTFGFQLDNTGNGDDSFTIELSDNIPEGWEVTPMNSVITIAKGDSRSQLFTAFAPADFDSGSKEITVTVTSEDGIFTESFDVEIMLSNIVLSVDQGDIVTLSDNIANRVGKLVIPIENTGFLGSNDVVVSAKIVGGRDLGAQTISVDPESTSNAVFDLEADDASGTVRFEVRIEVVGEDSSFIDEPVDEFDFSIEYYIDEDADDSLWFTLVIFVLGALVIYGGIKISRRSSSSARF